LASTQTDKPQQKQRRFLEPCQGGAEWLLMEAGEATWTSTCLQTLTY
jgi:hypothetical protein